MVPLQLPRGRNRWFDRFRKADSGDDDWFDKYTLPRSTRAAWLVLGAGFGVTVVNVWALIAFGDDEWATEGGSEGDAWSLFLIGALAGLIATWRGARYLLWPPSREPDAD